MKQLMTAAAILLLTTQAGSAESCHDHFVRLMVGGNDVGPIKTHVTQEIKGAPASTNYFYQAAPGHWMTQMIKPANQGWVLAYNNTMYTSSDKGKSWKKIRTMDSAANAESGRKSRAESAKTVKNAQCAEEALEGVAHKVVEADFEGAQGMKTSNHYTYWVNAENGWISKAIYHVKSKSFESKTTQLVEPAPGLELPKPE